MHWPKRPWRVMNDRKITCLFVVDPAGSRPASWVILHIHDCLRAGVV